MNINPHPFFNLANNMYRSRGDKRVEVEANQLAMDPTHMNSEASRVGKRFQASRTLVSQIRIHVKLFQMTTHVMMVGNCGATELTKSRGTQPDHVIFQHHVQFSHTCNNKKDSTDSFYCHCHTTS